MPEAAPPSTLLEDADSLFLRHMHAAAVFDPSTQQEYHRRQGFDPRDPPFCVRRDSCVEQRHFFADCPTVSSPDDYDNIRGYWAELEETKQQMIWDNNAR